MSSKDHTETSFIDARPNTSEGFDDLVSNLAKKSSIGQKPNSASLTRADYDHLFSITTSHIACFHYPNGIPLQSSKRELVDQLWSKESRCLEVSEALAKSAGLTCRNEALGKDFSAIFPPNARYFSLIKDWVSQDLKPDELFSPYKDNHGRKRIVFTSIYSRVEDDLITHIWLISRDRTRLWDQKKASERAERHYRELLERPGVFLLRQNAFRTFSYISPHFEENFAIAIEELRDSPQLFVHLIHPDDVAKYRRSSERRDAGYRGLIEREFRLRHKDNSYHWYYERQTAATNSNESLQFVDSLLINIQERKHLESSILHAQRMDTLGAMAGGIAHDFNNQLAAILGQLNLSLDELPQDSPVYKRLSAAEQSALACADLTKHLLSFARHTESIREPLDLKDFLSNNVSLLKRILPSSIDLSLELSDDPVVGFCNQTELHQVITNLCLNARDAMPDGGSISIVAKPVTIHRSSDRLRYPQVVVGKYIELAVKDSGTGIAPEHLSHIFDPYFTTKGASTNSSGLGLATVYSIIKRHKGEIRVDSSPGQGACFSFLIPESHVAPHKAAKTKIPQVTKGSETILVAEDDEMVHEMVRSALENSGYSVIAVKDGAQAVDAFKKHRDKIALAILDHGMPEKSGREVVEELTKLRPELPVILTSGFDQVDLGPLQKNTNTSFLSKPYHVNNLLFKVRSLLNVNSTPI